MQTLRQNWLGYRITLFALILQFCLSFGHSHHDLTAHPHVSWPVVICHSAPDHPCSLPSHDEEHDSCAICFALAVMGSAVAAASPALIIKLDLIDNRFFATADAPRHLKTAFMFQARAPPLAV